MPYSPSLFERDDCVQCPAAPPPCNCQATESCVTISRSCSACPTTVCRSATQPQVNKPKSNFSPGALAGEVIACLLVVILVIGGYFYYTRRYVPRRKAAAIEKENAARDAPAPAAAVLSRPDPTEKQPAPAPLPPVPVSPAAGTITTIDIGQPQQVPSIVEPENPFADQVSIQTASNSSQSTNVIPIAYVPPPQRPERAPDLDLRLEPAGSARSLNLEHANVSQEDFFLRTPRANYAESARSGASQSTVASTASSASSAVDFLREAPTIITPLTGVRQVLGVTKAQVVPAPSTPSARSPTRSSRATVQTRSPLAQNSFTPADLAAEATNPFADGEDEAETASRSRHESMTDSVRSASTFGPSSRWPMPPPPFPGGDTRPSSVNSNTGSIVADISSATRVVVGMRTPATATYPPTPGRRITPASSAVQSIISDSRRISDSSMASSRADSILEAFPFVPPSPISATPPRTPQQGTFSPPSPGIVQQPMSAPPHETRSRHFLGLSTFSTASSGLGAFPFQFDHPAPNGDARASLDTIALSRDVQAFPLPYDAGDRGSFAKPA